MPRFVAFLRGINVGGNNTVPMKQLKCLFEGLSFSDVSTYINSGNVLFTSRVADKGLLTKRIEKGLLKQFGFPVACIIRTAENIQLLAKKLPPEWKNDTEQKTDILFLWDAYDSKASLKLLKTHPDVDRLLYVPGAIAWNISRALYTKSGIHAFIGTELYKNMTGRNINTVRKLAKLLA